MKAQGRQAIYELLQSKASWPPVIVPFGLDPWGWHGGREGYRELCELARERCTLLPKVFPLDKPLGSEDGELRIQSEERTDSEGTTLRVRRLIGGPHTLSSEDIRGAGELAWRTRKRWIESDADLAAFLELGQLPPAVPDVRSLRAKEAQVGQHGLPYAEVVDPFAAVCEMFLTEDFYVRLLTDRPRVEALLSFTSERILAGIESLCGEAGCPFILRLIGAEQAVPPFLKREDFLRFEGPFYRRAAEIAARYGVPAAFHCHGPVAEILDDVWSMGYSFIEPFEPPPRGNIGIAAALRRTAGRGVVFGGVDDVLLSTGSSEEVQRAVESCLRQARDAGGPYILSQSATPFFDPLTEKAKRNLLLFLECALAG
jgi:hypothetical protein